MTNIYKIEIPNTYRYNDESFILLTRYNCCNCCLIHFKVLKIIGKMYGEFQIF
jgi:hypothetical protein